MINAKLNEIKNDEIRLATKKVQTKFLQWKKGSTILIDSEIEPIVRTIIFEGNPLDNYNSFNIIKIDSSTNLVDSQLAKELREKEFYCLFNKLFVAFPFDAEFLVKECEIIEAKLDWGGEIADFQMDNKPLQPITAGVANLHAHIDAGYAKIDDIVIDLTRTIATVDCDVYLETRATHMSRVAQTIESGGKSIESIVKGVKRALGANTKVDMKFSFDALASNEAPISHQKTTHPLQVSIEHKEIRTIAAEEPLNIITVKTQGTSCCPCSRNMSLLINNLTWREKFDLFAYQSNEKLVEKLINSGFGAHNQRSNLTASITFPAGNWINIAAIYKALVDSFSAPIVNILKRPDEKFQTELMYNGKIINSDNVLIELNGFGAKFSEDIVRDAMNNLEQFCIKNNAKSIKVICENEESIHTSTARSIAQKEFGQ